MGILSSIEQLDRNFFLLLNGYHNVWWDYVMSLFTQPLIWVPFYLVILATIIKKYGKESLWIIIAVALLILFSDQAANILKHSVKRLRPSHDPVLSELTHIVFTKGGLYSFVSGHAANSFSFATFFILLFKNRKFTFFIIPWALLICYTRIYLGLHYPGDILGGIIIGILDGIVVYKLLSIFKTKFIRINSFLSDKLSLKEAKAIIYTGILTVALCMLIVSLLMNIQLLKLNV